MNDNDKIIHFNQIVEKMIRDEDYQDSPIDEGIEEMISLAEEIINIDFSGDSRVKDQLRSHLIKKINKEDMNQDSFGSDELNDDELNEVVGGLNNEAESSKKALYPCEQTADAIEGEICPVCGYPRSLHLNP